MWMNIKTFVREQGLLVKSNAVKICEDAPPAPIGALLRIGCMQVAVVNSRVRQARIESKEAWTHLSISSNTLALRFFNTS